MDVSPTFAQLAGSEARGGVDGESLLPLFAGAERLDRDAVFWHFPHYLPGRQTPASAIRMGDWKLIEFFEDGELELYNLKSDIGEKNNLAAKEPAKAKELHAAMRKWRKETKAPVPTEKNPRYDPKAVFRPGRRN